MTEEDVGEKIKVQTSLVEDAINRIKVLQAERGNLEAQLRDIPICAGTTPASFLDVARSGDCGRM